jgi:hypothetical protein
VAGVVTRDLDHASFGKQRCLHGNSLHGMD